MDKIYEQIWNLAKPHYKKGRPQDVTHIEWIMKEAKLVAKQEKLDETILIPLAILHDVGYSRVPKDNSYKKQIRELHMQEGSIIAREILEKLKYPKAQKEKIIYYVSIHDSWAIGNSKEFRKDKILGAFNDLDFIWMTTPIGFETVRKMIGKTPQEMIEYIVSDEKYKLRPMNKTTQKLFNQYLENIKKTIRN